MGILSIVVPTKNRHDTALITIGNLTRLQGDDIEIIVQDCSSTPALGRMLRDSISDQRLRYQHSHEPVSMTDNWNRALRRATGEYVLIVGDDDAVVQEAVDAARWAETAGVEAIVSHPSLYWWPDYANPRRAGWLMIPKCTGEIRFTNPHDELARQVVDGTLHLTTLPQLYHGIVRLSFLQEMKARTGFFVKSTIPDFYASWALSTLVTACASLDVPLTVLGYSALSNVGRARLRTVHEHFREYGNPCDDGVPPSKMNHWYLESQLSNAMSSALMDMGRTELLRRFPVARAYGAPMFSDLRRAPALFREFEAAAQEVGQRTGALRALPQLGFYAFRSFRQRARSRLIEGLPPLAFRMRQYHTVRASTVDEAATYQAAHTSRRQIAPLLARSERC